MVNIILKIRNKAFEDNAVSDTENIKIFFELYLHFKKEGVVSTLMEGMVSTLIVQTCQSVVIFWHVTDGNCLENIF